MTEQETNRLLHLLNKCVNRSSEKYENINQAINIFAYSKSLPVEFAVMLIKDLIIKDENIATLSEFDEWMQKYADYIL